MYLVLLTDNIAVEAAKVFDRYENIETVRTETLSPDQLKETIADFDAVIVRSPTRLTADVIEAAEKLKYIGRAGVGTDNIDLEAATQRGVVVMNSVGASAVSTAEHTVALVLALARHIPQAHRSVTSGEWDRTTHRGVELYGKTLGVIGLGRVGREVARRMRAFEMKIIAVDPAVGTDDATAVGAVLADMDDLLRESHVITVHVPLESGTTLLIGEAEIALMRDGALLVNCSRGGVVSEEAVQAALESGKLAGVALDVYAEEPPGAHPLFGHPKCVFTPHIGAATSEARIRVHTEAALAVAEALDSGVIRNAVNAPGK
jgi:D-3-phosphoglycerate dehydrogenase